MNSLAQRIGAALFVSADTIKDGVTYHFSGADIFRVGALFMVFTYGLIALSTLSLQYAYCTLGALALFVVLTSAQSLYRRMAR